MRVEMELLAFSLASEPPEDPALVCFRHSFLLNDDEVVDPVQAARERAGVGVEEPVVVHSTSWRWSQRHRHLVLTFALCPFPPPTELSWTPVTLKDEHQLGRPADPAPSEPPISNVAVHALRHLAWLLQQESTSVMKATEEHRDLWDQVRGYSPAPAGSLSPGRGTS